MILRDASCPLVVLPAHPADVDAGVGRGGLLEVEVVLLDDGHVVDKVGARPPLRPPPLIPEVNYLISRFNFLND